MQTKIDMRDFFAKNALEQIPKILTLLDRNQHSKTYGCFDRNYWHYRIIDFPSGMSQELVLPLALVYSLNIPGNQFYQKKIIRDWVLAGMRFAELSSHKDGSCDDYFPYEKAGGATAFSLLACLYSYKIMGFSDRNLEAFFLKRSDWLSRHHENGRLTNHQCLIALCLMLASEILDTNKWESAIEERIDRILDWQDSEGWFHEYEGCDLGYHTLSISLLSWMYQINCQPRILESLKRAIKFSSYFIHPDGSYGGEYSSRNTYNFFPHGFELMANDIPEAIAINNKFLSGIREKLVPCYSDDHIIGHHTWNYLLAWRDYKERKFHQEAVRTYEKRTWFPNAKLLVDRCGDKTLYLSLSKGGVFKLFDKKNLIVSDTHFSVMMKDGRNAVGHLIGENSFSIGDGGICVYGNLGWSKSKQMTTFNLMVLRLVMLSGGRFFPDLIRGLLQKVLITGRRDSGHTFKRMMSWTDDGELIVSDSLESKEWDKIRSVKIGVDQTSIYVIMSRVYQPGQLRQWIDLPLSTTKKGKKIHLERVY